MNNRGFPQTEVDFHFLQNALQNFTHDAAVVSPTSLDWSDSPYDDEFLFMSTVSHDSFSSSASAINTPGINTPETFCTWDPALYGDCTNLAIQYSRQTRESQDRWMNQVNPLGIANYFEPRFAQTSSANTLVDRTTQNLDAQDFRRLPFGPNHSQPFRASKSEILGKGNPVTSNTAANPDLHAAISISGASKRKSASAIASRPNDQHRPVKKTAHNMIEKRYRNKLNDSIAELRDNIPSLRLGSLGVGKDGDPMPKLYKATVITKAVEHISVLEKEISRLIDEIGDLKSKFETHASGNRNNNKNEGKGDRETYASANL